MSRCRTASVAERYAIAVGRFYEDLAERLGAGGARGGARGGGGGGGGGGRRRGGGGGGGCGGGGGVGAAPRREVRRGGGPLRGRRVPRRGDRGGDEPLRLRVLGGGVGHRAGLARHGRAMRLRRTHGGE